MPRSASLAQGGAHPCAPADDDESLQAPDEQWWDHLVSRMARELQKQLSQIESLKARDVNNATERTANARTLDSLQRTMERLMRAEQGRAAARERKVQLGDGEARNVLVRRLDQLTAAEAAAEISERSEQ